ncbi:MAG: DUF4062 domain-containing protein [Bacteroidales bacterium]|jgi:hypothetical protein|nr:DUF4062 domain-containing protein [Bacteroidales bacterium]
MRKDGNKKIKIMVGSTVYGFEDQLSTIVSQLTTMGYGVLNSHTGTIKVNPELSNLENCLNAVDECDLFLGIVRPHYGSGNIGEKNITFEEIKRAMELKKPYWFLVHRDVIFARQLFKKIKTRDNAKKLFDVIDIKPNNLFDYRCIEIYEYVIKQTVLPELRNGNWAQEFYRLDEAMAYINTQFSDREFIMTILKQKEANNGK